MAVTDQAMAAGQERQAGVERRGVMRRLLDLLAVGRAGRWVTLGVAVAAAGAGVFTFAAVTGQGALGLPPGTILWLVNVNLVLLLVLAAILAVRVVRVWAERRRGSAGSRLHVRLVVLFGLVAVTPTIIVTGFSAAFFNRGLETWFNERVRTALEESLAASKAYLEEHQRTIRAEALAMANDLNRAGQLLVTQGPNVFSVLLERQIVFRGLTEAVVFNAANGRLVATAGLLVPPVGQSLPAWAMDFARSGEVALLPTTGQDRVRALVALDIPGPLMLLVGRPVDQAVLGHMDRTEKAVAEYQRLEASRSGLQITFALIFTVVALLILFAAVLVGLVIAGQMARPISSLVFAAERVRAGDLAVRVPERQSDDEIGVLSRAFNRMIGQLSANRDELMDAYGQIDERRRFTEGVLAGVSAGVIGLDGQGRINLPNRSASELLGTDLVAHLGDPLAAVAPEFAEPLAKAAANPRAATEAEVRIGPASARRTLLVRIGTEMAEEERVRGFVVTFDDVTALVSAQRQAAWADVARRIAHEIKNPLTPIQLSAERLKRKYLAEISSDRETFLTCTDTIVRQVGDIGRMVDEFSAFARMPQPVLRPEGVADIVRQAVFLQKNAHPEIAYQVTIPDPSPIALCDRRLIGQALTNLLQNAADAVASRPAAGHIAVTVTAGEGTGGPGWAVIAVEDDGEGLPAEGRESLIEPYVTRKTKGTGLGLAIVKKIMEDHAGRLDLADRPDGMLGARVTLTLPLAPLPMAAAQTQRTAAVEPVREPDTAPDRETEMPKAAHGA